MSNDCSIHPKQPRRDSRLRFTLRGLLALVTLLCIVLSVWTHRARQQRRLIESIRFAGGDVHYDFQLWGDPSKQTQSRIPRWILDRLGEDYFHEVTEVTVKDPALLPALTRFRRLECLTIFNRSLSDASTPPLARLRKLKALSVYPDDWGGAVGPVVTDVGDGTLAMIAELPTLELANVMGSRITSQGLELLARSKSLRHLQIVSYDSSVDGEAAEPFRRMGRAGVYIQRWWPKGGSKVVADFGP